ncbi:hydroxysqualene dehydroxylase HpnE [Methylobacterium oxalidis]|uniref:Amine oxidase domain-containing protein n=1 Tax=Methylobacterium oxalidis TaxID=944322 RepID=A0A512JDX6_9HYPH|nr:hydroxysqualene dehydroxylase HpnE [Methylobacterium oxalidis]GEP08117.1 hypothetical protein MOX02_61550 [Methylobacterium oxalidis]GJE35757.1 Hydroxysqualene dehydroxylase [Methylobacterium oxalidis]GLS61704.1 hypothetical protein GCM10007888_00850 [Methylobacterium oxalidis]
MQGAVHVVGAGLSGLAAAVDLVDTGRPVVVHEAAAHAGGRCRSYHDTQLGMTIDNGNHLALSGNRAALGFLDRIGGRSAVAEAPRAEYPFVDLDTGERWTLHPNPGRVPWWVADPRRRVPGSRIGDYAEILGLLVADKGTKITDVVRCEGLLYERLWRPVLLAALNIDPKDADAVLAGQVLRETFVAGGRACRPVIAEDGLSKAFVDPALRYLAERGAAVRYGRCLQRLAFNRNRVAGLAFGDDVILLGPEDKVVLAVPSRAAAALVPGLDAPQECRGIANIHFKARCPPSQPRMTGVVNGLSDWIFAYPGRVSVTVSGSDLAELGREELARRIWSEVSYVTGLYMAGMSDALPPWQVIRERRATFAATPAAATSRSGCRTEFRNLFVAGDWTDTGLPACIEGAVRSGNAASTAVIEAMR